MSAPAELGAVIIDCADPTRLAEFYQSMLGWEVTSSDDDFTYLGNGGSIQLAFQRIDGYQGPDWPDERKHVHLDVAVADPEAMSSRLVELGATKPEFQPGGDEYVVLADPEGHVFCLAGT